MGDPRFDNVNDLRLVQKRSGWFTLEHIDEIQCGSLASPSAKTDVAARWFEFYGLSSAAASTARLFIIELATTCTTTAVQTALHVTLTDTHAGVAATSIGGEAAYIEYDNAGANRGNVGYFAALQTRMTVGAASVALGTMGTYASLFCVMNLATGADMPQTCAFINFRERGAGLTRNFFDSSLLASQTDGAWETDSGAIGGTVLGYYRVFTAGGIGYLVVYSSHA